MIILKSTYIADPSTLETHLPAHLEWVEAGYASGNFLSSGLRDGGVGAVIMITGMSKDQVQDMLSRDPFVINKVSEYEVVEFETMRTEGGFPQG
jgi:uncharacterized protein YciI